MRPEMQTFTDATLDVSAAVRAALPSRDIGEIIRRFERGDWGRRNGHDRDRPGFYLLGCYDVSDCRVPVLADHGHSMTRVVLAEEA
jgi:hypothetical protein